MPKKSVLNNIMRELNSSSDRYVNPYREEADSLNVELKRMQLEDKKSGKIKSDNTTESERLRTTYAIAMSKLNAERPISLEEAEAIRARNRIEYGSDIQSRAIANIETLPEQFHTEQDSSLAANVQDAVKRREEYAPVAQKIMLGKIKEQEELKRQTDAAERESKAIDDLRSAQQDFLESFPEDDESPEYKAALNDYKSVLRESIDRAKGDAGMQKFQIKDEDKDALDWYFKTERPSGFGAEAEKARETYDAVARKLQSRYPHLGIVI